MTYVELSRMSRCEVARLYILSQMRIFNQKLVSITLYRHHSEREQLISNITCHLLDRKGNVHPRTFKLYDEEYLWFLNSISLEFPDVSFQDLTEEKDKLIGGEKNDAETSI